MKLKEGKKLYARYKSTSKRKNSQLNEMRIIKIIKSPHYNKRFHKGKILKVLDLSDIGKSTIVKTFYLDKLEVIDEIVNNSKPEEGIPPNKK